ncbi:MAG: hypothetical protein NDI88_03890 [Lysobacter sp.]|nr:hypothetical protein [Lysobacter sp.]
MDTIRIAGAQSREQAPQASSRNAVPEAPETAIRTLDDWELLLAGGGDVSPEWPTTNG